jgi:hypothetical protein
MGTCLSWYLPMLRRLEERFEHNSPSAPLGTTEVQGYGHYVIEKRYVPLTGGGCSSLPRYRIEGPMNSVVRFTA